MNVKAYNTNTSGFGTGATNSGAFANAVSNAFGGSSTATEGQPKLVYDLFTALGTALLSPAGNDDSKPSAYLNYMVFDEQYNLLDAGFSEIDATPNAEKSITASNIAITKAGYVYIYVSNESNSANYVYFDNLNITVHESRILEKSDYYPFGLTFNSYNKGGMIGQNFKYNGKELVTDLDLGWYDYQARWYDPALGRWHAVDPAADLMRRHSPYNYAFDNPIMFIDPDGMIPDVTITGGASEKAFNGLQASVKSELTLSKDDNGKVSYEKTGDGELSKDAQQLTNAIDDHSVNVNIKAENTKTTESGDLYIGGAFSGNEVTKSEGGNTVTANQEVNPEVLGKMSDTHGKPGADILHEVTEAYQGAKISQKKGKSSPAAGAAGSVYPKAHGRATKQSGKIYERVYDGSGKEMQMPASGGYPAGVKGADWYVKGKKGNKVVIQDLK